MLVLRGVMWGFYFPHWKHTIVYVQFDGMVYQRIVGIPMGANCTPLIADLFFILLWEGLCLNFTNLNVMTS